MKPSLRLIITSPCGEHEWHQPATFVPAVGTGITCRERNGDVQFEGVVDHVHLGLRMGWPDYYEDAPIEGTARPIEQMTVSVWLREVDQ